MEPWLSWGIALVVGGLAFYYYNAQTKPQPNKTRATSISESIPSAVKPARKRDDVKAKPKNPAPVSRVIEATASTLDPRKGDVNTSSGETTTRKRKAGKKQPAPAQSVPTPAAASGSARDEEDLAEEDDNKAWAQQLLSMKKGTSLAPPQRTDSRNKTVKQSAAGRAPEFSSASSNAADADDDWTPARSPTLAAGDVSDMLEPTASGPNVLRLTESVKPAKAKQQRQAPAEVVESKKARQNRKKVEERKLQREAEERERQTLLEAQRRTAREARGEPARNGVQSKPPAVSEWAVKAAERATQAPSQEVGTSNAGLLDTFDEPPRPSVPSEEDQFLMAKKMSEDESGWNTVPKGKKQKKTKPTGQAEANSSDAGSAPYTASEAAPAPVAPSVPVVSHKASTSASNGYGYSPSYTYDAGSHPEDSPWTA
ncbi:hypothetical protein AAFC00_005391 [Neodothiora populina]|uniref:Uncharacterized protein n=1 Tax=Neodothiora populina TaxID=2781224 RepID=A0ABR3PL01_9PEZI